MLMPLPALAIGGIAAGAASLLGSIISGASSASSQERANQTNLQIARETNKANREMFDSQLAWQEDMWNKTNAYNSPENQVALLQRAGINPAAVYGSGSTSDASLPSVPSAPQMQGTTVNPIDYSFISQGVDNGINAYFNAQIQNNNVKKMSADAQIANIQAELDSVAMADRARKIASDSSKSEAERDAARLELAFLTRTQDERVYQTEQTSRLMEQQYDELVNKIAESRLRQDSMRIANEFAPKANEYVIKQYQANIEQMYAAARAGDASAAQSYAMAALSDLQASGVKIDNKTKERTADHLVNKAKYEANLAKENVYAAEDARFMRPVDFYQKHLGKAANYTITPGAASATATMMDRDSKRDRLGPKHKEKFRPKRNY